MDVKELIDFLLKFDVEQEKIDDFIKDKNIIEKNKHVFLTVDEFDKNQVFGDGLIFINLNGFLPSSYLLEFIRVNSKTIIVKNEKQSLNFSYFKSLAISTIEQMRLLQNRYYIVEFAGVALGYADFDKKNIKKLPIRNLMNIGEYLKES